MLHTLSSFSLEGKTALITGGSTGLGLSITRCMVGAGATVCVLSYEKEEEGRSALQEFGERARYYYFDVTDTDHTRETVDHILHDNPVLDILINNAGNHCKKPVEDMTVADYCSVLNVHLVGSFAMCKAVIPHMKKNRSGSILFQASMTSFIGQPEVAGYASAKAGYLGLMRTLATECGEYNVRVNAIAPGWIDTPMFHQATDNDTPRLEKILGRIPLNHIGDPMDIGMAAVFLCSDAARYISGVCLPVDGGALIGF